MFTGSVSNANIEEDQSIMKKDLKSFEVAELDTIPKQNLDRNAQFNGNNYETVIFIVLGLCLAFIVLISAVHVLLSWFYLDFIQVLSRFLRNSLYSNFIQILSWFYLDKIKIKSRQNRDKIEIKGHGRAFWGKNRDEHYFYSWVHFGQTTFCYTVFA